MSILDSIRQEVAQLQSMTGAQLRHANSPQIQQMVSAKPDYKAPSLDDALRENLKATPRRFVEGMQNLGSFGKQVGYSLLGAPNDKLQEHATQMAQTQNEQNTRDPNGKIARQIFSSIPPAMAGAALGGAVAPVGAGMEGGVGLLANTMANGGVGAATGMMASQSPQGALAGLIPGAASAIGSGAKLAGAGLGGTLSKIPLLGSLGEVGQAVANSPYLGAAVKSLGGGGAVASQAIAPAVAQILDNIDNPRISKKDLRQKISSLADIVSSITQSQQQQASVPESPDMPQQQSSFTPPANLGTKSLADILAAAGYRGNT